MTQINEASLINPHSPFFASSKKQASKQPAAFARIMGYCEQFDTHSSGATVAGVDPDTQPDWTKMLAFRGPPPAADSVSMHRRLSRVSTMSRDSDVDPFYTGEFVRTGELPPLQGHRATTPPPTRTYKFRQLYAAGSPAEQQSPTSEQRLKMFNDGLEQQP